MFRNLLKSKFKKFQELEMPSIMLTFVAVFGNGGKYILNLLVSPRGTSVPFSLDVPIVEPVVKYF